MSRERSHWPIQGHILLEGATPIAVFPHEEQAVRAFDMYKKENIGVKYTLLSPNGYCTGHIHAKDNPQEKAKDD